MTTRETMSDLQDGHSHPHLLRAWQQAESYCIKCGFCLPCCPTYRETGVEASSPRGRLDLMYAAAQGRLALEAIDHELWFCLGCLACETACPSGIRFRDMLEAARVDATAAPAQRSARSRGRLLLNALLVRPGRLRALLWGMWAYQRSGLQTLLRASRLLRLVPPLARLERQMPPVPRPLAWRPTVPRDALAGQAPQGQAVTLLTGCVMDAAFGTVHAAVVEVLHRNGYRTVLPPEQTCCGALHLHAGAHEDARALARRNIAAFEQAGSLPILTDSAGCGALLKDYGALLADDPDWAERARAFAARVRDVSEFLAAIPLRPAPGQVPLRVAYDDPCHLLHGQGIRAAPRQLLAQVPGLELVPLAESDWCCGSAGSYSVTHPDSSARVLARKMEQIAASGARVVATGNPGCLLQLRMGAHDHGLALEVVHPVELLARAYRG